MNSERLLLDKWRSLTTVQQQKVLGFVERMADRFSGEKPSSVLLSERERRVREWMDWARTSPKDSPGLPDDALSRDSIYEED